MTVPQFNARQQRVSHHLYEIDPDGKLLGYHTGRPVLHTHIDHGWGKDDTRRRHVVVLTRHGEMVDLPTTWADRWEPYMPTAEAAAIIDDWFSWAVRT